MRVRALTLGRLVRAAANSDVRPLAIASQNIWLDWIEAEPGGGSKTACLAIDNLSEGP
jgi:hypothetical protein